MKSVPTLLLLRCMPTAGRTNDDAGRYPTTDQNATERRTEFRRLIFNDSDYSDLRRKL